MDYLPNYESFGIPGFDDILKNLGNNGQELAGLSNSEDIAKWFGFNPDKYSKYFNPANISSIKEGLGAVPELAQFLRSNNRKDYSRNKSGLLGMIGKTGLAGTGSFDSKFGEINDRFTSKMFSSDKQIQDLIQGYQNQLNSEVGNMFSSAMSLRGSGAKTHSEDWFEEKKTFYGTRGPGYYYDPNHMGSQAFQEEV